MMVFDFVIMILWIDWLLPFLLGSCTVAPRESIDNIVVGTSVSIYPSLDIFSLDGVAISFKQ